MRLCLKFDPVLRKYLIVTDPMSHIKCLLTDFISLTILYFFNISQKKFVDFYNVSILLHQKGCLEL
jgi:hypothetical protein